ncbi:MAG: hypothetical protein DVB29_04190 [Verrucomicrobia bacterium]|nr:MAG: hypothetical protein DVB29_04190 [Verrucomicrobiota bacterium]
MKIRKLFILMLTLFLMQGCHKKKNSLETVLPRKSYEVIKMANGALVESHVTSKEGMNDALQTSTTPNSYGLDLTLHVTVPAPAMTMKALCAATPELANALPTLKEMLPPAPQEGVKNSSLFYSRLFENKIKMLHYQLSHLGQLPSRESLFDCQTILPLTNTTTQSTAILVQAIMNVNADGSDGDRNLLLEKLSSTYQPQTNYRWPKTTSRPNPNINELREHLALVQKSLSDEKITPEQKSRLALESSSLQSTLIELERWSFLVGSADPFIVLPKFMLEKIKDGASIGDYAVVLYQGILYPAIVGDIGPASKIGEASLRICRAIDSQSSETHRPLSAPHVSYFIFPGSKDYPFQAPDYSHWSERCHELWKNLGGSDKVTWHEWEKCDQPWPEIQPQINPDIS